MKIIIVDDEFPARKLIVHYLKDEDDITIVRECCNGIEAFEYISKNAVDLVFLDIRMSNMNGIELAEKINGITKPPMIIFTTGYTEFAVKAFEVNAVDYIVKPYTKDRIMEAFRKAQEMKATQVYGRISEDIKYQQGKITVWNGDSIAIIKYSEIFFFSAFKHGASHVHTDTEIFVTTLSLKEIEEKLGTQKFMRVHKSYVVNLEHIEKITPSFNSTYELSMASSGQTVPVSRNYISDFRKVMGINQF
jgi:DNA-binding LytR/AlgR family response regulator